MIWERALELKAIWTSTRISSRFQLARTRRLREDTLIATDWSVDMLPWDVDTTLRRTPAASLAHLHAYIAP